MISPRKDQVTFADLERIAKLEQTKPLFRAASESLHGGVQGLKSLGIPECMDDFLYAGPSTSGLLDPAQNTAISLAHFTTDRLERAVDRLVSLGVPDRHRRRQDQVIVRPLSPRPI